ncbi:hypothetical protein Tco_1278617 [Tanacetum coccineum]
MADLNSPMPVARHAMDELIEFSRCFLERMRNEAQSSRSCLAQLDAMISKLEAMNDAGELFDSLMCLRDDKRVESEKLLLLNEMIDMVEEDIATKEAYVSSG